MGTMRNDNDVTMDSLDTTVDYNAPVGRREAFQPSGRREAFQSEQGQPSTARQDLRALLDLAQSVPVPKSTATSGHRGPPA